MSFEITQGITYINKNKIMLSFFSKSVFVQNDLNLNKSEYKSFLNFLYLSGYENLNYNNNKGQVKKIKLKEIKMCKPIAIILKRTEGIYRTSEGGGTYKNAVFLSFFNENCMISGLNKEITPSCIKELLRFVKSVNMESVIYYRRNNGRNVEKKVVFKEEKLTLKISNLI